MPVTIPMDKKILEVIANCAGDELSLSRKRLEEFPIEICGLTHLKTLDLIGNDIKFIPHEINNLII